MKTIRMEYRVIPAERPIDIRVWLPQWREESDPPSAWSPFYQDNNLLVYLSEQEALSFVDERRAARARFLARQEQEKQA